VAVRPKSGEPTAVSGRARAGGRPVGPWGSITGLGRVGTAAGGLGRWRRVAPATAPSSPARGEAKSVSGGWWKLQGMLREAPGPSVGSGGGWNDGLNCGGAHGAVELRRGQRGACTREGTRRP
jgi:hypothetical protein